MRMAAWPNRNTRFRILAALSICGPHNNGHPYMNGGRNVRIVPGSYYRVFGVVFFPPHRSANSINKRSLSESFGTMIWAISPIMSNR